MSRLMGHFDTQITSKYLRGLEQEDILHIGRLHSPLNGVKIKQGSVEGVKMTRLNIELDDATTQSSLKIAQRHCKLALEHSKANTLPKRREAIRAEIGRLRAERNALLESFELEGMK
nr:hypothetical protein [Paenibacillus sp. Pae15]